MDSTPPPPIAMTLHAAGTKATITSVEALDEAIDEHHAAAAARGRPLLITLTHGDAPEVMRLSVGADEAVITWTNQPYSRHDVPTDATSQERPTSHPQTVMSTNGGSDDDPTIEVDFADRVSVFPAWAFIPATITREAARVFYRTRGRRPDTPNFAWADC